MTQPKNRELAAGQVGNFIDEWWKNATHPDTTLDTSDWILCFMTMTGMLVDVRAKNREEAEVLTQAIVSHMGEGIMRFYDQSKRTFN